MIKFGRGSAIAVVFVALSFVVAGAAQAAGCADDVKKAQAEWAQIQSKGDAGELSNYPQRGGKAVRSLSEVLRKADEASKAGKNRRCEKLLQTLRGRWKEKGWQ